MNERFLVIKNIKEFILSLDNIINNYPRREYELRNRIVNDSYNLLELVYKANNSSNKRIYFESILANISMLDFYLEVSFKKKIISEKVCSNKANKLLVINKMVYKWLSNESKD